MFQQNDPIFIVMHSMEVITRPLLDITDGVNSAGHEQVLVGLAFDPAYSNTGYFYVHSIGGTDAGISVVSSFTLAQIPTAQI